ncbi:MAG TPA: hypothetical protein PLI95_17005 [Polyangiaceae bacterium]|nr:hypothetical protein [Polyangiaceae bacterium]
MVLPRCLVAAALVSLSLPSCLVVASSPPPSSAQHGETIVVVRADGTPEPTLPFDRRAAKLEQATRQLDDLVGHPVSFRIEASLIPAEQSGFEERLTRSIESVAQQLAALKRQRPAAFTWAATTLRWIECRYDASARHPSQQLLADQGVLRLTLPPETWDLVERGVVFRALDKGFDAHLEQRWSATRPDAVQPSERALYFEYLTSVSPAWRSGSRLESAEDFARDPRGEVLRKVIRLHEMMEEGPERAAVGDWLLKAASHFITAYLHQPALVQAAAPDSSFHRAETAWVQWLHRNLPRFDPAQRLSLARALFLRRFNPEQRARKFVPFAFPGFDTLGFALGVAHEWARNGYPSVDNDPSPKTELYEFVVCPYERDERGGFSRGRRCNHDLYALALDTPEGADRLVRFVLERRDARLTDAAFVSVLHVGDAQDVMRLWRGVEAHEDTWLRGSMILAEHGEHKAPSLMIDEAARLWKQYPARRGTLLYLLANLDPYAHGNVPWERFAQVFGAPVSRTEFASFLDQSHRAPSMMHIVWSALGSDWDRSDVIVPRLERWMDHPRIRDAGGQEPNASVRGLVTRLCDDGRSNEVSRVNRFLRERVQRRPSEERGYHQLIDETTQPRCRLARKER